MRWSRKRRRSARRSFSSTTRRTARMARGRAPPSATLSSAAPPNRAACRSGSSRSRAIRLTARSSSIGAYDRSYERTSPRHGPSSLRSLPCSRAGALSSRTCAKAALSSSTRVRRLTTQGRRAAGPRPTIGDESRAAHRARDKPMSSTTLTSAGALSCPTGRAAPYRRQEVVRTLAKLHATFYGKAHLEPALKPLTAPRDSPRGLPARASGCAAP